MAIPFDMELTVVRSSNFTLAVFTKKIVTKSHFGHNSEIRARKWEVDNGVNWKELKTLSNKIQYHIRKRMAVAKVPGCPVLPHAYELARSGYALKLAAQTPWAYELQNVPG
jgi:hypothetical protein